MQSNQKKRKRSYYLRKSKAVISSGIGIEHLMKASFQAKLEFSEKAVRARKRTELPYYLRCNLWILEWIRRLIADTLGGV